MAGNYAQPQQPDSINISQDRRTWAEVCPDEYFSLEYVGTREFTLHIVAVMQEKIGDKLKAVLRFSNDPRGLVLNKTNRDTLAKLFGESPADVIGKTIRVGMGFVNRNPALCIKGAGYATQQPAADTTVANGQANTQVANPPPGDTSATAPNVPPEMAEMFRAWQQQQGAK